MMFTVIMYLVTYTVLVELAAAGGVLFLAIAFSTMPVAEKSFLGMVCLSVIAFALTIGVGLIQ